MESFLNLLSVFFECRPSRAFPRENGHLGELFFFLNSFISFVTSRFFDYVSRPRLVEMLRRTGRRTCDGPTAAPSRVSPCFALVPHSDVSHGNGVWSSGHSLLFWQLMSLLVRPTGLASRAAEAAGRVLASKLVVSVCASQ